MQVKIRAVTCCLLLLCSWAEALISDDECANYHELHTDTDYETFVDDCAGKEVLGFEEGVARKFHAFHLDEKLFNKLFKNARTIGFHIYVENTDFVSLQLPKLEKLVGGITIRNNQMLTSFRIRRGFHFSKNSDAPTTVTVDGNKILNEDSMNDLRSLCPYCDIFHWTKCSALDTVTPFDYPELVRRCQGEKIIKMKPHKKVELDLRYMTQAQFEMLFAEATHVQMCITMRDVQWKRLIFPKLRRLIPCGSGDRALKVIHNGNLKDIQFPMYHSEGFGRLNQMINIELRNNFVLDEKIIVSLRPHCRFCTLQPYKECDDLEHRHVRNATRFVELCGGKKIWKPKDPNEVLVLDISRLSEDLILELFQDVIYVKMCITLRSSKIKSLPMPNLVEAHPCEAGMPAFTIEGNMNLKEIIISKNFQWAMCPESFHIVYSPALVTFPVQITNPSQCKYCVFEKDTRCGAGGRLSYTKWDEFKSNCVKKRKLNYRSVVGEISEKLFGQFFENLLYLQMCINVTNTDYVSMNALKLRAMRSCDSDGERPVIVIYGNSDLEAVDIPSDVIYPSKQKILYVKRNPKLPSENILILKKICPHCEIEGFFSKCADLENVHTLDEFMAKCAGQSVIRGKHGLILEFNFTEVQLNQLFSKVIEVQMCLNIRGAEISKLEFPLLKKWRACSPGTPYKIHDNTQPLRSDYVLLEVRGWAGKPAINFLNNPYLTIIDFPSCGENCIESGTVKGNPRLPPKVYENLEKWCPHCKLQKYIPACGLGKVTSVKEFVKACVGMEIVGPAPGDKIEIDASQVPEKDMNKFCENTIFLEACITLSATNYKSFRCPHLKELRSCEKGRPAITVIGNAYLEVFEIPLTVRIYETDIILISRNPQLPPFYIDVLKKICPKCQIEDHFSKCALMDFMDSREDFISQCSSQPIITPAGNIILDFNLTETEVISLLSEAVEVQMCVTIQRSTAKKLTFPKLRRWTSCSPDRPAIKVVMNPLLEHLVFPSCKDKHCIQNGLITGNPLLSDRDIADLRKHCADCIIRVELPACGLGDTKFDARQFVRACAGKEMIVPPKNKSIIIDARLIPEFELNDFCSKAVYMKVCIVLSETKYRSLRCPKLQEMQPCVTGTPVFEIIENSQLTTVYIPPNVVYPEGENVLVVSRNPKLPANNVEKLKEICPYCPIYVYYAGCDLTKITSLRDIVTKCSKQPVIYGNLTLEWDNSLEEIDFDKWISDAVEIRLCLTIRSSQLRRIVFPKVTRWRSCDGVRPALVIENNVHLTTLLFLACKTDSCLESAVIRNNPELPQGHLDKIGKHCKHCTIDPFVPACGLGDRRYTPEQFVDACAGHELIIPSKHYYVTIDVSRIPEKKMLAFCSKAVYLEACITMKETNYKAFRCPHLQEMHACRRGKPVLEIVGNNALEVVEIPRTVIYEKKANIMIVRLNPKLPSEIIANLKGICPYCNIEWFQSKCLAVKATGGVENFLVHCGGEPVILPEAGTIIDIEITTEEQLTRLFHKAYEVQMCLTVKHSAIKRMVFPHVVRWRSCSPNRPALTIVENMHLHELSFPSCSRQGCIESAVIKNNKDLPNDQLKLIGRWCTNCVFETYQPACGLGTHKYTAAEFVKQCADKEIILPSEDYYVVITTRDFTIEQLNRFCSKAVLMQICLEITDSDIRELRCPYLRELRPCKPGRPAIVIRNNTELHDIVIPPDVKYPSETQIVEIIANPKLPEAIIKKLKTWCPQCLIRGPTVGLPDLGLPEEGRCPLQNRQYSDKELVKFCAGYRVIVPHEGFILELSSERVTEVEMNAFCSKAIYMKICIDIVRSNFTGLRCPHLKQIEPCVSGRPAIRIDSNMHFDVLQFPLTLLIPNNVPLFEITENPHLPLVTIDWFKKRCSRCKVTANLGCDLEGRVYTDREVVAACAGKRIIRPAKGYMLYFRSSSTSEQQLNALCSKAVYMEICIDISHSSFKSLRCPYLQELKSCQPGRPAIRIVGNYDFNTLEFPKHFIIPKHERLFEIAENPHLSAAVIDQFRHLCPHCHLSANLGCGLNKRDYSDREMIDACAGKKIIKPAEGYQLVLNSKTVTEEQFNALCSQAVYMEICITIERSNIKSLRCPHLRELKPCRPGLPALKVVNNPQLEELEISDALLYRQGTRMIEVHDNRRLRSYWIRRLSLLCPECYIR